MSYSLDGWPHIELIQGPPGSLWETDEDRLHHVGMWATDLQGDCEALIASGFDLVGRGSNEEGAFVRLAYHRSPYGHYIELVDPLLRPAWAKWIAGGSLDLSGHTLVHIHGPVCTCCRGGEPASPQTAPPA